MIGKRFPFSVVGTNREIKIAGRIGSTSSRGGKRVSVSWGRGVSHQVTREGLGR